MNTRTELGVALSLAGFGVYELYKCYRDVAPDLDTLRNAPAHDTYTRQGLRDADVMLGGLAVLAGGAASVLSRSPWPLLIVAAGFVWVSGYHHVIAGGATVPQIDPRYGGSGEK
jgi:hypothetical protein